MKYSNIHKSSSVRKQYKKKYTGNYLGIVVQNNDPESRGRIKIFIPHITPSVYSNWTEIIKDKKFKFVGRNIDSDLTNIIDDLKQVLPWSECAAPLVGASGSGRYHAKTETASISDSNKQPTMSSYPVQDSKYNLNKSNIGEKPGYIYEVSELKVHDAFNSTTSDGKRLGQPNRINKTSFNYTPGSYSNITKGSFSVPNVGSHVWAFFREGDPMHPVYFATSYGTEDWKSIYDISENESGIDYPGAYENKSNKDNPSYTSNTDIYRNKYVLNQKGGTIEIVSTDNRELLKFTHYSGSFKEFNNTTTSEFAANNYQKLINGDEFSTVKGTKNQFIQSEYDLIIRGDLFTKIGTFNKSKFVEWRDKVSEIANIKHLFEIKRATYNPNRNRTFSKTSTLQTLEGSFAPCPVCTASNRQKSWVVNSAASEMNIAPVTIENRFTSFLSSFITPNQFSFTELPSLSPGSVFGDNCPACNGSGISPSSQDGTFASQDKDLLIKEKLSSVIGDLANIEKELGEGGSEIITITKHKHETIGLLMNDFPSIRIDEIGKIVNSEIRILQGGVLTNVAASPLIEYVHVDDMPGGTYTITAANKFNVQTGSGGVSFKSYGPVDIGGTITNITGEQVNIVSENEINIVSQKRVNISAEILSLRQSKNKQVLIDSNLGVSQNMVVAGSAHIEGELTVHHITAPAEIQETEKVAVFGQPVSNAIIGYVDIPFNPASQYGSARPGRFVIYGSGVPNSIECYDHSHLFRNIPLNLMNTSDDVRKIGSNCDQAMKMPPAPIENSKKGTESVI